jgi:hypothetical protein
VHVLIQVYQVHNSLNLAELVQQVLAPSQPGCGVTDHGRGAGTTTRSLPVIAVIPAFVIRYRRLTISTKPRSNNVLPAELPTAIVPPARIRVRKRRSLTSSCIRLARRHSFSESGAREENARLVKLHHHPCVALTRERQLQWLV